MKRLALITGGTRGIGRATALLLKSLGYNVVVTYHDDKRKSEATTFAQENELFLYKFDVSKFDECQNNIAKINEEHGAIDILINNAGVYEFKAFHKASENDWDKTININLKSCFNMCRGVINQMKERKFGRIVSISAILSFVGSLGASIYCASKAGIIGMTRAIALEVANYNITVNTVAPGATNTDMMQNLDKSLQDVIINGIPCTRFGKPEEVARAIAFLVHDDAGYITGETISVNGGAFMK